ncbi:uncharacterized protein LOC106132004 [Amyelois transitella]|uniref:uncharacterized protein LOC106132004 n=1 Tax=Amyelois transitella TaxID=680683 RepID=UPI00067B8794|nr:uncharacterized protein LOC106132004 [Amyelois transitella]
MVSHVVKLCLNIIVAVNIQTCLLCPLRSNPSLHDALVDAKAVYKSGRGEILDMETPITLDKIKSKLKEAHIFNPEVENLSYRDKKELTKLFNAVEIMTTSRNRQPSNVQNMFATLRLVERAQKKLIKEGQISESLAAKFHWENFPTRQKRERPSYTLDKRTKMRIFDVTY